MPLFKSHSEKLLPKFNESATIINKDNKISTIHFGECKNRSATHFYRARAPLFRTINKEDKLSAIHFSRWKIGAPLFSSEGERHSLEPHSFYRRQISATHFSRLKIETHSTFKVMEEERAKPFSLIIESNLRNVKRWPSYT